ncbi:MAG: 5-(carboxyamino)imidazole ribonucleotide mutase [Clostridiales bacterium]|jgi:5-(carboxyamino)imidazole ribonucleotide mutase|nr:5-(carboxyamino)imidazole ribonucleotide mutase [Clostridiales bacterium]
MSGPVKLAKVLIVIGSDSDFPVVEPCIKLLNEFSVQTDVHVCSAHRTPERASELARGAEADGVDVVIAAAGKAAHLPGVLAAYTPLPVIGLPVKSSTLDGLDSLLSIVQMPSGIPVATVALDGAENAALLAVQIISVRDAVLRGKMKEYKAELARKVEKKDRGIQEKLKALYPRA